MTELEAIEWLSPKTSPMKIHMAEMQKEIPMEYINEAVDVAIMALEKQIPKKPLHIITDDNEYICSICPICQQRAVEVTDLYCIVCGQKLDWRNEDAE